MYPMAGDGRYGEEEFESWDELKTHAEKMFDDLNFPIAWSFYPDEDFLDSEPSFTLTVLLPRKQTTTDWTVKEYDRAEVEEWLNSRVKAEVHRWYGWATS